MTTTDCEGDTMTDRAVIVDIDGTLALRTGDRSPFDWHRVGEDTPNPPVIELVQLIHAAGRHRKRHQHDRRRRE